MIRRLTKLFDILHNYPLLKMLLSMNSSGYLKEIGWINSFNHKMPIDRTNDPLPWVTYPFIDFIETRLKHTMEVLEYGCGNSTLWYANRTKYVTSIEHDQVWFEKIKKSMPDNVSVYLVNLAHSQEYFLYLNQIEKKFHLIIIDGRERVNCIKNSINRLTPDGIIVLDDSERQKYQDGINYLLENGFKKIDFWGISPGLFYKKNTTVFYKNDNCLGI